MALSALRGGAAGLRASGGEHVAAFRAETDKPILGILKQYVDGKVVITPDFASAREVAEAGADVVALDCTARRGLATPLLPEPWPELVARIHTELKKPVMADIATLAEAEAAVAAGADAVATTLYGYTPETEGAHGLNWELIAAMAARCAVPVLVEGHVSRPEEVARALDLGAWAVVVGSAITRPETITARFCQAIHERSR